MLALYYVLKSNAQGSMYWLVDLNIGHCEELPFFNRINLISDIARFMCTVYTVLRKTD